MLEIKRHRKASLTVLAACLLSSIALPIYASRAIAHPEDDLLAQHHQAEDLVTVTSFYVTVTLTGQAQERLESNHETVVVLATLLGEARTDAELMLDESDRVDLTSSQHELTGSGRTTQFDDLAIVSETVEQLTSRDYIVNINVFSGRRSSDDNLLACDVFESKMSNLQPGVTLRCGLIGEYDSQFFSISNHSVRRDISDH